MIISKFFLFIFHLSSYSMLAFEIALFICVSINDIFFKNVKFGCPLQFINIFFHLGRKVGQATILLIYISVNLGRKVGQPPIGSNGTLIYLFPCTWAKKWDNHPLGPIYIYSRAPGQKSGTTTPIYNFFPCTWAEKWDNHPFI